MLVHRELEVTRSVKSRDPLSRFFRTQTRWELLLMIAANNGAEEIGIWSYIDRLTTRTESPMTIYAFIRDRIDDGTLVMHQGSKRSRKVLNLSSEISASLNNFLSQRYIENHATVSETPDGEGDESIEANTFPILPHDEQRWQADANVNVLSIQPLIYSI